LGAEQVIDYRAVHFEEHVSGMDVVFDTVGGDTLQRSWGVLKPRGRMITIAAESETTTDTRVKQAFFIVEPNREQLIRIGDLLESGALHPVVDAVLPLTQASTAYTGEVRETRARKARRDGRTWYLRRGDQAGPVPWKKVRMGSLNALVSPHYRGPSPAAGAAGQPRRPQDG
jgi:Zinc-binding dehydrogenase